MQAKTLSLIAKIVSVAMLLTTFIMIVVFGKTSIPVIPIVILAAAVSGMFGDVSLSIWFDKFLKNKNAKEAPVDPENQG